MIAQFARPPEELSFPLFPLVLLGIVYAIVFVAARVMAGRGEARTAESLDVAGFIVMVGAAVYTLILAIYAVAMRSELVWEATKILLIVFGFFALLLAVMLLIETAVGSLGRSRRGRLRAQAPAAGEEPAPAGPPSAGQRG